MRPTINQYGSFVDFDVIESSGTRRVSVPWDAANNRVFDADGEAGRSYARALAEHPGMTEPDPPVPPPEPAPGEIADFQFAAALMARGAITPAEASAFVKVGDIPAALQVAIDAIPDAQQRAMAELRVSGATTYRLDHPLTLALAAALGWSDADVEDLWRAAAAL